MSKYDFDGNQRPSPDTEAYKRLFSQDARMQRFVNGDPIPTEEDFWRLRRQIGEERAKEPKVVSVGKKRGLFGKND